MLNQQYTHLSRIDSYIEPLLKRVLEANKLGICCGTIQVESTSSSCDKAEGDRFKLLIPYARHTITWDVLFDSQRPELGPDFIFNDDTFLIDMNIDTLSAKVPSLAKWNVNNENALLNVLMELLSCYRQHQIELLQKQERFEMEYSVLMNSTEIAQEDVEVILLPFGSKPTEARFLISLSINPQLDEEHETYGPENETAMLLVTFYGPNWNRIMPQIYFSKYLEYVLNKSYQLPHYLSDKLLNDYVVEIKKNIEEKIRSRVECRQKRKLFVMTALALQAKSVLEYDSKDYYYIAFLFVKKDFSSVVIITLSPNFPSIKPTITLKSPYHMTVDRQSYHENLENFKYSPKWFPVDMIDEIFKSINTNIDKFKLKSIQTCS
ncbi:BRISC and BRCA1-A complex member 2 [Lasioglossum baleicum]|uniref:BRISC and BRCA1-A complex member 2 n=1 Tax=Lasioglossum baleicum TaxID=434251 RepID=UPI003FCD9213